MSEPIPGPPPLPIVGNVHNIDLVNSFTSFANLADTYGTQSSLNL
jgi:cytochrome P450/NADPH-cytochrome P450 reductase